MRGIPKYDFRHFFQVQGGPRGVDIGTKQPGAEKEQILWIHAFAEKLEKEKSRMPMLVKMKENGFKNRSMQMLNDYRHRIHKAYAAIRA